MITNVPRWAWVALLVACFVGLLLWQYTSGWSEARRLHNLLVGNLREDQSNIIRVKEENEKMYEAEIAKLEVELIEIKRKESAARAEVTRLQRRNRELQIARENIVVPSDPDALVNDLRLMGFRSARRIRSR